MLLQTEMIPLAANRTERDTALAMPRENAETMRAVRYRISLPSERAGQRRSLDERLFVRAPVLYRQLAAAVARLPPRSRLRRSILARRAGRVGAAVNRRDFAVLFLGLEPDIEYLPPSDQLPPGMDAVRHGYDDYEEVWRQMIDSFEDFHAEPEELFDLGDTLLVMTEYKGHGTGSGVPVNLPLYQLFRLRRGLVFWQKDFSDRSEALEAAGLSA
jgi:SnoaL-like domain